MTTVRSVNQDRILDEAEAVFARKGYRGGALNDVAVALGYTRAGLLHHYPSKQALLLAILERRDERLHAMETVGPDETIHDVMAKLPVLLPQLQDLRTLIELGHIVTAEASSPEHPAHAWCVARERKLRDDFAASIRRAQARGELAASLEPDVLSALLLGAFEGLEGQWLLSGDVNVGAGMEIMSRLLKAYRD